MIPSTKTAADPIQARVEEEHSKIQPDERDDIDFADAGSAELNEALDMIRETFTKISSNEIKKSRATHFLQRVKKVCSTQSNLLSSLYTFGNPSKYIANTNRPRKKCQTLIPEKTRNANTKKKYPSSSKSAQPFAGIGPSKGGKKLKTRGAPRKDQRIEHGYSKTSGPNEAFQGIKPHGRPPMKLFETFRE